MPHRALLVSKVLTGGVWILSAGCFFAWPETGLSGLGRLLFWVLLVAHAAEFGFVYPKLRRSGRPIGGQFVGMLLFGMLHYAGVREEIRRSESPA